MNCFNHVTTPAVAICKNCNKGLCPDCLTEIKNGIACTATCIGEVKSINELIERNKNLSKRAVSTYNRTVFIYGSMGLLFIYAAYIYPELNLYMYPAGGLFLLISVLTFIANKKRYKNNS